MNEDKKRKENSCEEHELTECFPRKKARHAWQIKSSSNNNEQANMQMQSQGESSMLMDELSNRTAVSNSHTGLGCIDNEGQLTEQESINEMHSNMEHSAEINANNDAMDNNNTIQQALPHQVPVPGSGNGNGGGRDETNHLRHWHSQHIAKSLVDNAINKTLEDLGLSPEETPWMTPYGRHKQCIESEGVLEAIRCRGLRRHSLPNKTSSENIVSPTSLSLTSTMSTRSSAHHHLTPIISCLTQVSEDILTGGSVDAATINATVNLQSSHSNVSNASQQHSLQVQQQDLQHSRLFSGEMVDDLPSSDGQCDSSSDGECMFEEGDVQSSMTDLHPLFGSDSMSSTTVPRCSRTKLSNAGGGRSVSGNNSNSSPMTSVTQQVLAEAVGAAIVEKGLVL